MLLAHKITHSSKRTSKASNLKFVTLNCGFEKHFTTSVLTGIGTVASTGPVQTFTQDSNMIRKRLISSELDLVHLDRVCLS